MSMSQTLLKKQRWLHTRLGERKEDGEEGFTLIELLIVLLIIGILLAIAIPTYLSVVGSASSNTAQTNLQTAITAADAISASNGDKFPSTNLALLNALNAQGDDITWENATPATTNTNEVSFDDFSSGDYVIFAVAGSGGACFYAAVVDTATTGSPSATNSGVTTTIGTFYNPAGTTTNTASTTTTASSNTTPSCTAANPPTSGWGTTHS